MPRISDLQARGLLLLVLLILLPRDAAASYLDPGTGSYVLQILAATLLGGLYTIKHYYAELKAWVLRRFGRAAAPDDAR